MKDQVVFDQIDSKYYNLVNKQTGNLLNPNHEKSSRVQSESSSSMAPIAFTALSTVSTLAIIYLLSKNANNNNKRSNLERSTPLPGYGILGDNVNEFIELFLDALAVYVHNDQDCQRRMLCEANQRASEYGSFQAVVMYFLSIAVSLFLQNQRVSESLEAMKRGRHGNDCTNLYPKCPFSL